MRYLRYLFGLCLIAITMFVRSAAVSALEIPPAPSNTSVVDQTETLAPEDLANLEALITAERTKSGNQIAVLMISTLQGDDLEDYSIRVARGWGVGEKSNNNGVLLLVVKDDRKLRIEAGYGLEGALTDARSAQIIRDQITPKFKKGEYYQGITSGLQGIIDSIHNEYQAAPSEPPNWSGFLYIGIFAISWLASIFARSKNWLAGGIVGFVAGLILYTQFSDLIIGGIIIAVTTLFGLLLDWTVSRNYQQHKINGSNPSWWAGGSRFGSGSSGSSGGFGGGSFGGGGSSGSW